MPEQYVTSEKFQIGWFKLAEFVTRKERERAFGMYRLLAHSLADVALAAQLEGDLLLAFNDEKACDAYHRAAKLYEADGKLIQAAAVYEHCSALDPQRADYVQELVRLYSILQMPLNIVRSLSSLLTLWIARNRLDLAQAILEDIALDGIYKAQVYEQYISVYLTRMPFDQSIHKIISYVTTAYAENEEKLNAFVTKLAMLSLEAHSYALDYLTAHD